MRLRLLSMLLLSACSSTTEVSSWLSPYRIDVNQGNYVTQEMVARLKPGMSREEVRFILGTPLIADIFHADRWDYVYRFQPGHGEPQQRRLVIYFTDGKLARVGGDVVPAAGEALPAEKPPARVIEIGSEDKTENRASQ